MSDMRLCLCMIVRDEAHVVGRALQSVRDIIDYWVICDTGSTDGTMDRIIEALAGVPGELHRVGWVNFGHNRTDVLRRAKGKADYILIMDADMAAVVRGPFKNKLSADAYDIRYEGDLDYCQPMLVAGRHDWAYVGVTHEYIAAPTARVTRPLPELTLHHFCDGGSRPEKYTRDVALLTAALQENPNDIRHTFYLAQTYKDMDDYANAFLWYEKRIAMEGWEEERWYAMYQSARMRLAMGQDWEIALAALLRAYAFRPSRLEPLFEIVKHYREAGQYSLAYTFAAMAGHGLAYPNDSLFVERPVYEYLLLLEYGVAAYGAGRFAEAIEAFNRLLRKPDLPGWVADSALRGRSLVLQDRFRPAATRGDAKNRIVVISTFHNAGESLTRCVDSLMRQDYCDFAVLFVDDASTDDCAQILPAADPRVRVFQNRTQRGALANLAFLLEDYFLPDDVVVCVDGYDWLDCPDALSHVNRLYAEHDCWVTYGQFRDADGARGFCEPFASAEDFRTLRWRFRTSHLLTFRAGVFHRLVEQDPELSCLKDDKGEWLDGAAYAALTTPLLEIAGFDRVRYNDRILYVCDSRRPHSFHHLECEWQTALFASLARKRPFVQVADFRVGQAGSLPRPFLSEATARLSRVCLQTVGVD